MAFMSSRDYTINDTSTIISPEERKYGNIKSLESVNKSLIRLSELKNREWD